MKKYLIALMVLVMALALVACGVETADTTVPVATDAPEAEHVHNFIEELVPATCTTTGKIVVKCDCGEIQSESEIPLADHTASALDCEKDTVCTVCNTVLAEKTGHTMTSTEVVVAASCTAGGKEKGICATCGKIVENETPVAGHKASKESVWEMVSDGFKTTCVACNQVVTMKEADVILNLTFEGDFDEELAKYPAFSRVNDFKIVDDTDGDKALQVVVNYIDVVDTSVFANAGTYVVSFDVMVTKDAGAGTEGSMFSILGNFAGGKADQGGKTSWGYAFKYHQDLAKFEIIKAEKDASKLNASNSIDVKKSQKYNVTLLVAEGTQKFLVFFDGKMLGLSEQSAPDFSKVAKVSLRFGDGPNPGFIVDNFKIASLK